MIYLRLFFEFFKTGLFAVGGGLATLPFLFNMAESTGWFTADTIMDMIAVSLPCFAVSTFLNASIISAVGGSES